MNPDRELVCSTLPRRRKVFKMLYTRRDIGKLALTAVPLATLAAKPDSKYSGVQVGAISYSFREMPDPNNCEALLKHMTDLGLNGIELMNAPAETFAGAPVVQRMPGALLPRQVHRARDLRRSRRSSKLR